MRKLRPGNAETTKQHIKGWALTRTWFLSPRSTAHRHTHQFSRPTWQICDEGFESHTPNKGPGPSQESGSQHLPKVRRCPEAPLPFPTMTTSSLDRAEALQRYRGDPGEHPFPGRQQEQPQMLALAPSVLYPCWWGHLQQPHTFCSSSSGLPQDPGCCLESGSPWKPHPLSPETSQMTIKL